MTYFKDIKPGDPLPSRPDDYFHKLVRVYPGTVQTAYSDEEGAEGGSSFSVTCDPRGQQMRRVGVFPDGQESTTPDSRSPTGLYRFTETPYTWSRHQAPQSVRPSYDKACVEAGEFIRESLDPFRQAVRSGQANAHPLGALSPIARPSFERLAEEFDYYAKRAGRSPGGRVTHDEIATLSFQEGVRLYTGVDLNHDGILDVLSVHDETSRRDLLIYDLERAPAFVKSLVAKVEVPRAELDLLPVAARFGGEACRSSTTSHVPFPDYVTPEAPTASVPLRGLLDFYLEPKEAISPLCARDIILTIKFYTTEYVNYSGHHRFRDVTDLDRFFRAQEKAIRRGTELASRLPDARWPADAEARFSIPHSPPGRLWRIGPLYSPAPTVHWTSDREGYVEIMLDSVSADGAIQSHPFQFPFTADEGQVKWGQDSY